MKKLDDWIRYRDILICVDSDGCAMDTMDIKHKTCFGPQMIACYGLEAYTSEVEKIWNEINLYRKTRGINRFMGLVATLKEIEERGICATPPYDRLAEWVEHTSELSNPALKAEAEQTQDPQLLLALEWSKRVNTAIAALPQDRGAFAGVKESLKSLSDKADIAVVSSANGEALAEEWNRCQLDRYTGAVLGQEYGTKALCIENLIRAGNYAPARVVMVGDAMGDAKAAEKNGVCFYPILVGREEFSWKRLCQDGFDRLASGAFTGEYQEQLLKEFYDNFS